MNLSTFCPAGMRTGNVLVRLAMANHLSLLLLCLAAFPLTSAAATADPGATSQAFYYLVVDGVDSDQLNGAVLNNDGTLTPRLITDNSGVFNGQVASSDGITWYNTFTSGADVRLFAGPSSQTGRINVEEISASSNAPSAILDFATVDQSNFFFLTTAGEVFSGVLQDDGSFVTTLITSTAGAPAGTFGFATTDGVTFYLAADDGAGTAAFYSATLSAAGLATNLLNADSGIPLAGNGLVAAMTTFNLVANGPEVCAGERFIASSNNGYPMNSDEMTFTSYSWQGPNGFTSTEPNIEITNFSADDAGPYTVTVTFPAGNTLECTTEVGLSSDCGEACDCVEYAYVNDFRNNLTHKFEIQPDGSFAEIGSPWLPFNGDQINQPHGVSVDPNGFIYIAELGEENYVKLTCDGDIVDGEAEQVDGFNHVIIGDFLFIPNNRRFLEVYELCDGSKSFVGFAAVGEPEDQAPNTSNWGITFNPLDSFIYVTDNYNPDNADFAPGEGQIYRVDSRDPLAASSIFQTNGTIPPYLSGFNRLMGITFDPDNNLYFVEQEVNRANSNVYKYMFDGTDYVFESVATDDTDLPARVGFYDAWGLTYSMTAGELLVTSFTEDCISRIDAETMTYIGPAVPHVPGAVAKAIDVSQECCYRGPSSIDVEACVGGELRLREALDCSICTGLFTRISGTGGFYDECTQEFIADENTTNSTFRFMDDNNQCGPVTVDINLIFINAVVTAPALSVDSICIEDNPLVLLEEVFANNSNGGATIAGTFNFNIIVGMDTTFDVATFDPGQFEPNTRVTITVTFEPESGIGECTRVVDFPFVVSPDACCPFVELIPRGDPVCSTDSVGLAGLVDSIFINEDFTYVWTTSGDGTFNGDDPDDDPATGLYPSAMDYVPGPQDINNGRVTLSLATTDGDDECPQRSDAVVVDLLKVGCGVFNWDGTNR